jgi:hypothetical protein
MGISKALWVGTKYKTWGNNAQGLKKSCHDSTEDEYM